MECDSTLSYNNISHGTVEFNVLYYNIILPILSVWISTINIMILQKNIYARLWTNRNKNPPIVSIELWRYEQSYKQGGFTVKKRN